MPGLGGCGGRGLHAKSKVWLFGDAAERQVWGDSAAAGGLRRESIQPHISPVHSCLPLGSLKALKEETAELE